MPFRYIHLYDGNHVYFVCVLFIAFIFTAVPIIRLVHSNHFVFLSFCAFSFWIYYTLHFFFFLIFLQIIIRLLFALSPVCFCLRPVVVCYRAHFFPLLFIHFAALSLFIFLSSYSLFLFLFLPLSSHSHISFTLRRAVPCVLISIKIVIVSFIIGGFYASITM